MNRTGSLLIIFIFSIVSTLFSQNESIAAAEIWRKNAKEVSKIFIFDKIVKRAVLDPRPELVDSNYDNNALHGPMSFNKIELTCPKENNT